MSDAPGAPDAYEAEVLAWRATRRSRLVAEDGWLSIVAKQLLSEGKNVIGKNPASDVVLPPTAPDFVGTAWLEKGAVRIEAAPGVPLLCNGEPLPSRALASDAAALPDIVTLGSLSFHVLSRGNERYLRVKDRESQARLSFGEIPYYPIQKKWRVTAKVEPYSPKKVVELDYEGGQAERYESPGRAVFEMDGAYYSVDPVIDRGTPRLYLLFRDATYKDETYGAGRFLYAALPKDGTVVLDFNKAFNPPCALTEFASCPLTPGQNKLDLRVTAGEKRPNL